MQELKDHWSDLMKYLHAFNIHDYDADLSNFTEDMNNYVESKKNELVKNPVTFEFYEILRYNSEPLKDFFTKRDASYLKSTNLSKSDLKLISEMDNKELSKFILNIVKDQIKTGIKELETKAQVLTSPLIEKGKVIINISLGELFSYSDLGTDNKYAETSVDHLLAKGISDVAEIFDKRVSGRMNKIKPVLEKLNIVLTDTIVSDYLNK
jgi:hypothetical protein